MDVNHDLFDANQPADGELERALSQMLARRSADIDRPGPLRLATDAATPLPAGTAGDHRPPGGLLGTLLAAAAVVLLVAGSILVVHTVANRHSPAASQPSPSRPAPTPMPSPSVTGQRVSCPLPPSWRMAITSQLISVDQPINQPLSAGPGGSFLMLQSAAGQTDFTHQELAIFDLAGHGTTIWTAADPAHDYVDVSPDSAMSAGWVVFGLARSQNLAAHGVAAWNRATGQLSTVREQSAAELAANQVIDFDPIVVGNTAYWIEQKFNDAKHQQLIAQPLPAGTRTSQPVSQVSRLIALGTGVGLLHEAGQSVPGTVQGDTETLTAGPGLSLPQQVRDVATGSWFGTESGTLRWLSHGALTSWQVGSGSVDSVAVAPIPLGARPVGPFLVGETSMLDTRDGVLIRAAAALSFALVSGSDLLVTTGASKFGGTQVHRVALSALAPTRC